jgi:hypothetical protein
MDQSIELDTKLIDEFCLENEKSYERKNGIRCPPVKVIPREIDVCGSSRGPIWAAAYICPVTTPASPRVNTRYAAC